MPRRKARETFSRYDTAEGLNTEEDIARYLEAVLDEGGSDDPAFLAVALGNVARARNMSQLARDTGISREGLYKALSGDGNPSLATVMKIARALGLQLTFRPAGQARAPRTGRGGSRSAAVGRPLGPILCALVRKLAGACAADGSRAHACGLGFVAAPCQSGRASLACKAGRRFGSERVGISIRWTRRVGVAVASIALGCGRSR